MDDELLEPCPREPAGHWERFRQNWGRFNHTKVSPAVLERILLNKNTYLLLKNCKRNLCGKRQRKKLTELTFQNWLTGISSLLLYMVLLWIRYGTLKLRSHLKSRCQSLKQFSWYYFWIKYNLGFVCQVSTNFYNIYQILLFARFTRARDTGDKQDVAFTDNEGMYMIFPVRGGRYNGVNKRIKKHEVTPVPSTERIFIKSCRTGWFNLL